MRALVTGAAGLIGAHLVRALLMHGHEVRALMHKSNQPNALTGLPVTYATADVLSAGDVLDAACADCDVVFHVAAQFAYTGVDPVAMRDTAVIGTDNILRACSRLGVAKVVVTSSSVVFGYSADGSSVDEAAGVASETGEVPYVAAKIAQHQCALELGDRLDLSVLLACPTMTLGPTSSRLGPSNGIVAAYLADPFRCTYPGGCNLVTARDVALGHLLIAEHGVAGESYLLGSQNLTWPQIHAVIAELSGVAPPRFELGQTMTFLAAAADELCAAINGRVPLSTRDQASMVGRYYWYSHAKAAGLGFAPVTARDVLIETISWLAASPHIGREIRAGMRLAADIYRFRAMFTNKDSA